MLLIIRLIFLRMFIYVNTLYYTISLLIIVIFLLYTLVSNLMLHSLTIIMFSVVYIGAIIILIGYICAICPNLILSPSHFRFKFLFVFLVISYFFPPFLLPSSNINFLPILEFFYTYSGVLVFLTIVFMLFLTLLIVTSQYLTPKGPFRSVKI